MAAPRALLAVHDDTGLHSLVSELLELGFEVIVSGPQGAPLAQAGLRIIPVEFATQQANVLGGRLETLHPTLMAGIAARRDSPRELRALSDSGIPQVDLVVIDLPVRVDSGLSFEEAAAQFASSKAPIWAATLRIAVNNWRNVTVLVDPVDYDDVLAELRTAGATEARRRSLALKALRRLSSFDALMAKLLTGETLEAPAQTRALDASRAIPPEHHIGSSEESSETGPKERRESAAADESGGSFQAIARGGNSIASERLGALQTTRYIDSNRMLCTACEYEELTARSLSVEGLRDADLGWSMILDLPKGHAAALLHHGHACALSRVNHSVSHAAIRAVSSDPHAAIDGTLVTSDRIDLTCARALMQHPFGNKISTLVAPAFDKEALKVLQAQETLRLVTIATQAAGNTSRRLQATRFGLLLSKLSGPSPALKNLQASGETQLPDQLLPALEIALSAVRHSLSTAVAVADPQGTVAICQGQAHAMDALQIAVAKSKKRKQPLVLATDARLNNPDAFLVLGRSQIKAVLHCGPQLLEENVKNAADGVKIAVLGTETGWHRI